MTCDREAECEICTLRQLREDIALTREAAFFQTGSLGPVPDSTQRAICDALRAGSRSALRGPDAPSRHHRSAEKARRSLADLLHVSAEEIAWTENTSSANQLAVSALPWQEGDGLAVTGAEHVSTRILARGVEEITHRETTVVPVGDSATYSPDDFLQHVERLLTPDHRLLVISHVSCIDGRRLPVVEATRLAHDRGILVLVDGAQAVGQFAVDVGAIGPDFYSGSLHKWLLGPAGIAYLFVARRQMPRFYPNLMPRWPPVQKAGLPDRPQTAGARTEIGTAPISLRYGAGHALETVQRIGLDKIEDHVQALTARLRRGLTKLPDVHLLSPIPWALSSGITSLDLVGRRPEQVRSLIERLWERHRVVVKYQKEIDDIRVSVASFNTEEEIERLLHGLRDLT